MVAVRGLERARSAVRHKVPFFHGRLTRHPLVRFLLRALDLPGRVFYPEFRSLPSNDLRCRVGVGGRILGNEVQYLTKGLDLWLYLLSERICTFESDIVEIGCGCGRRTHLMRDYYFHGRRYSGRYIGIDIDAELLEWCQAHFDADRFRFFQSTHASEAYENEIAKQGVYELPVEDASVDLVFSTSVLTHLLEEQLVNYFEESYRALRPAGHMVMTCKCIDLHPSNHGNTYQYRVGNAYVETTRVPQAAVAYTSDFLLSSAISCGFKDVDILHAPGDTQHTLIAHR